MTGDLRENPSVDRTNPTDGTAGTPTGRTHIART